MRETDKYNSAELEEYKQKKIDFYEKLKIEAKEVAKQRSSLMPSSDSTSQSAVQGEGTQKEGDLQKKETDENIIKEQRENKIKALEDFLNSYRTLKCACESLQHCSDCHKMLEDLQSNTLIDTLQEMHNKAQELLKQIEDIIAHNATPEADLKTFADHALTGMNDAITLMDNANELRELGKRGKPAKGQMGELFIHAKDLANILYNARDSLTEITFPSSIWISLVLGKMTPNLKMLKEKLDHLSDRMAANIRQEKQKEVLLSILDLDKGSGLIRRQVRFHYHTHADPSELSRLLEKDDAALQAKLNEFREAAPPHPAREQLLETLRNGFNSTIRALAYSESDKTKREIISIADPNLKLIIKCLRPEASPPWDERHEYTLPTDRTSPRDVLWSLWSHQPKYPSCGFRSLLLILGDKDKSFLQPAGVERVQQALVKVYESILFVDLQEMETEGIRLQACPLVLKELDYPDEYTIHLRMTEKDLKRALNRPRKDGRTMSILTMVNYGGRNHSNCVDESTIEMDEISLNTRDPDIPSPFGMTWKNYMKYWKNMAVLPVLPYQQGEQADLAKQRETLKSLECHLIVSLYTLTNSKLTITREKYAMIARERLMEHIDEVRQIVPCSPKRDDLLKQMVSVFDKAVPGLINCDSREKRAEFLSQFRIPLTPSSYDLPD